MSNMISYQKRICIVLTGTIGSIRGFDLVRTLVKRNYFVQVVLTESAKQIITETSLQWASNNKVLSEIDAQTSYLQTGKDFDLYFVFSSSSFISKLANGIYDNYALLTLATAISNNKRILLLPLMHKELLTDVIKKNLNYLQSQGIVILNPNQEDNKLKVPDLDTILLEIEKNLTEQTFANKNIIISYGKTIEKIDNVRIITNIASGKLGYELALEFYRRGANVTVIQGNVDFKLPEQIKKINIKTIEELINSLKTNITKSTHIYISTIAVSDFKPLRKSNEKKLSSNKKQVIELIPNQKTLQYSKKAKNLIIFSLSNKLKNFNYPNLKFVVLANLEKYSEEDLELEIYDKNMKKINNFSGKRHELAKKLADTFQIIS
ncbi:MAG: phosphopantothenoylcysteine decarboxylase [Candidatus Anstonellales archaeon]